MQIPLELYKQIHSVMPMPCVDIILKRKGEILLVKRVNKPVEGQWWFPGGRVLKGETREAAVIRKSKEEIGVDVKILMELGTDDTIFENDGPFGETTHTINTVYLVEVDGNKDFSLDSQHSDYGWFSEVVENAHPYLKKYFNINKNLI